MPFKETCPMEERIALMREYEAGVFAVSDLCRRYGISRETFYVWKRRFESGEERWFEERSHAAASCRHATAGRLVGRIIATKRRFAHFGPKKVKAFLEREAPQEAWPSASTIGDVLKREGLVAEKRRARRPLERSAEDAAATAPNEEWAIDFKGWFRTKDGRRCDPLTITDSSSRYLIELRIVEPNGAGVRRALERVFAEFGLPAAMRSDNGAPFGSTGAGGLSALSVWWLKLGVEPRYIRPASPQDNPRHERMHGVLKKETSNPPATTARAQQMRFDRFRRHYNEERPHEALAQVPPATRWRPPTRAMPRRLDDPWYDADHQVRRVRPSGTIKWKGEEVFIGQALVGELIGLAERDNGCAMARFCGRDLGIIDRSRFLRFAPPRTRLRGAQETAPVDEKMPMTREH